MQVLGRSFTKMPTRLFLSNVPIVTDKNELFICGTDVE